MTERPIIGWDIGGAHLKVARLGARGAIRARHYATPLWRGLAALDAPMDDIRRAFAPPACVHVLTMSGELADVFADRADGVRRITDYVLARNGAADAYLYAGRRGFVPASETARHWPRIASGNWHATASLAARRLGAGCLIDIGTTTTDIAPFAQGRVLSRGYTDQQRLRSGELIYTGVARTPVMAVVSKAKFRGRWQSLAAECFATMADVYRLSGDLPPGFDLLPTADGGAKTAAGSRRRLARMLGADLRRYDESPAGRTDWTDLARSIAERQYESIAAGCARVLSRGDLARKEHAAAPLVAAGVGRFIIERLGRRFGRPVIAFEKVAAPKRRRAAAYDNCSAAIALTRLFRDECRR